MADYLDRPLTQVRRKDRVLHEPEWIDRLLAVAPTCTVAICHAGAPHVNTNIFWAEAGRLWLHMAPVGRFQAMIAAGATEATVTVTEIGRILPAATPLNFSTEYASVIAYGTIAVEDDPARKRAALDGIMAKYAAHLVPGTDYDIMPEADIERTTVLRLDVRERVAKHNIKPDDYPAYQYEAPAFIATERAAGRLTVKPKELA